MAAKGASAVQIWNWPIALRVVNITPDSYSVRASSSQRGTVDTTTNASANISISSVTTTRATQSYSGESTTDQARNDRSLTRTQLSAATTVTVTRGDATDANTIGATEVWEPL